MALTHTDTPVSTLKINKFATKADYEDAIAQGLITENELSFVEETTQANWTQLDSSEPDYIKNKPAIPTNSDFSLAGLSDTTVASPSNGQVLTYNGGAWVNSTPAADSDEKLALSVVPDYLLSDPTKDFSIIVTDNSDTPITTAKTRQYTKDLKLTIDNSESEAILSVGGYYNIGKLKLEYQSSGGCTELATDHLWFNDSSNNIGLKLYTNVNEWTDYQHEIKIPYKSGTIALLSDIPSVDYPVTDVQVNGTSVLSSKVANIVTNTAYNASSNKIATMSDLPAAQVNSDWNSSSGVSQILNKPTLATVATSGSYNDLSNKPTIPTNSDFSLSGLSDTIVSSPSDGNALVYNSTTQKWENGTIQGGGHLYTLTATKDAQTQEWSLTCDETITNIIANYTPGDTINLIDETNGLDILLPIVNANGGIVGACFTISSKIPIPGLSALISYFIQGQIESDNDIWTGYNDSSLDLSFVPNIAASTYNDGQVMTYDSTNGCWTGGIVTNVSNETNGQVLAYNSTSSKWENTTLTSGVMRVFTVS